MAFDESAYLAANPDVAAAVAAGAFSSGSEHYAQYGASEGRDAGGAYGGTAAAQPNYASGAGYASNITAPVGSTAYYAQLQDALGAYRAGSGVNPITGKTSAEEAGTWWNPGNNGMSNYYLANPDVMMNYLVNAGAKGVDPQQYAVAHSDMAQAGFDPGRQGLLPTGQTNFERLIGKEGGSVYNTFGQGESVFLDPRRGMVTPESDQAKYQQVYGNMRSNIGPFAGMETSYDRAGIQNSLTSAFNSLGSSGGKTGTTVGGGGAGTRPSAGTSGGSSTPITSGLFGSAAGNTGTYQPNKASAGGASDDYQKQMQDYYKAYFGETSAPNTTMLNSWYGGGYSPAPTGFSSSAPGVSAARSILNSLNTLASTNPTAAFQKLDEYRRTYGLSTKDIAGALGISEEDVIKHFAGAGIVIPVTSTTPTTNTTDFGGNG